MNANNANRLRYLYLQALTFLKFPWHMLFVFAAMLFKVKSDVDSFDKEPHCNLKNYIYSLIFRTLFIRKFIYYVYKQDHLTYLFNIANVGVRNFTRKRNLIINITLRKNIL